MIVIIPFKIGIIPSFFGRSTTMGQSISPWIIYDDAYPIYIQKFYDFINNYTISFYIIFSLIFAFLPILIFLVYRSFTVYKTPMRILLRGINIRPLKEEDKTGLEDLTKQLSEEIEVENPTILVTNSNKVNILSASESPDRSIILVSDHVLNSLNLEELESVFAHELWHIKTDLKEVTRSSLNFGYYLVVPQDIFAALIAVYIRFFSGIIFVIDILFFVLLYTIIYASCFYLERSAFLGSFFTDLREIDADCVSAVVTKNPLNLISAMRNLVLLKIQDINNRALALYFYNPLAKEKEEGNTWNDIVQPSRTSVWSYQHPPLSNRIKLLRLMNEALHNKLQIELKTDFKDLSWPRPLLLLSPFGKRVGKMSRDEIYRIYKYMRDNTERFNLERCAEELKIPEIQVLTVFMLFLMRKVMVIKQPAFR